MVKSFFSKFKATQGFAFPLVLLATILVISLLVAGLAPMITTQAQHVVHSEDQLLARYAVEAGVKRGARSAADYLATHFQANGDNFQPKDVPTVSSQTESLLKTGGVNYTYGYKYISGNGTSLNPERIEVTATATVNKTTATSMAWIIFNPKYVPGYKSPNLIDFITSANVNSKMNCYHYAKESNTNPWLIGTDALGRQYGSPQDGSNKNYILFNDDFESSEIHFDYNVKFTKTVGSGGAGVIYGASEGDTAYSFNAYCAKFNNDRQAFSVTKFYKESTNKIGVSQNEYFIDNKKAGTNAIDPNCISSNQAMFQPNGIDEYGNELGKCSITFTDLKKLVPDFNPAEATEYTITVQTAWKDVTVHTSKTTSYSDRRLEHIIKLNNIEVLRFVDLSDVNPVTKNDTIGPYPKNPQLDLERKKSKRQIRTGLRVVNVTSCQFYNSNIDESHYVNKIQRIIWKK